MGEGDAEGLGRRRLGDRIGHDESRGGGAFAEAAIALVHEEERRGAGEVARRAIGAAHAGEAEVLRAVEVARPAHVVADEEVEVAIAVGVEPCRARAPVVGLARHPGLGRDVVEASADVLEQHVLAHRRDVEVGPAVVVEVAGGDAHAVALHGEAGGRRGVGEVAGAIVRVEHHGRARRRPVRCRPRPGAAVHDDHVQIAVVVDVHEGAATTGGFGQQLFAGGAVHPRDAAEAGLGRDVDEPGGRAVAAARSRGVGPGRDGRRRPRMTNQTARAAPRRGAGPARSGRERTGRCAHGRVGRAAGVAGGGSFRCRS